MSSKRLPHVICVNCGSKIARDAYYCKKCEAVVDDVTAPGMKREDKHLISKIIFANKEHVFRNSLILIVLIIFVVTGIEMGSHYFSLTKDNKSSTIFQLTVDAPTKPLECIGSVCHILIDLKNKSHSTQTITATPNFLTATGGELKASDPTLFGTGSIYCQPQINLTLKAGVTKKYIGVCEVGAPHGSIISLVELTDSQGKLIVSGKLSSLVK